MLQRMALFVAKLFEQSAPPPRPASVAEEMDDVSPLLKAVVAPFHRSRENESIQGKIARALRKHAEGPQVRTRPPSDAVEQMLENKIRENRDSSSKSLTDSRWTGEVISRLQSIKLPPHQMTPEETLEVSILQLKEKLKSLQAELEAKRIEEERVREFLLAQANRIINENTKLHLKVHEVQEDISQIESLVSFNQEWITKGKFVESLLTCVRLSDWLHRLPAETLLANRDEVVKASETVAILRHSLKGRSRAVIDNRYSIFVNQIVTHLTSLLHDERDQVDAYSMLKRFKHVSEPFAAEEALCHKRLEKFHHMFARQESALNLVDKPEWPLRWFLDAANEMIGFIGESGRKEIGIFLAHRSKVYFRTYRWAIAEDSAIFSLYLVKYLLSASLWKDSFGDEALREFMADLTDSQLPLLEKWIEHDRSHIEKAIESTKNPYEASQFNPLVCNIVQTIIDLLDSSVARIESLKNHRTAWLRFIEGCHEQVLRQFMHQVRMDARDGLSPAHKDILCISLEVLVRSLKSSTLASAGLRKQLLDLINQI